MNKFRFILVIAVSMAVAASTSTQAATPTTAAAPTKVASVDMKKLFDGFWKTKQATALLDKDKADARKNLKGMADGLDKAVADYKLMATQSDDPAISADERSKRKQAADEKAKAINDSKTQFQQFQRQVESQLQDKSQRMSGSIVTEIQKAVSDQAKLGGYTVVVNSASVESVVYVSPDVDITPAVLTQLNAGAPIDVNAGAGAGLPLNLSTNAP